MARSHPITVPGHGTFKSHNFAAKSLGISRCQLINLVKYGQVNKPAELRQATNTKSIVIDGVKYNTRKEAAQALGISVVTLRTYIRLGVLHLAGKKKANGKPYHLGNITKHKDKVYMSQTHMAQETGYGLDSIFQCLQKGLPLETLSHRNKTYDGIPVVVHGYTFRSIASLARCLECRKATVRTHRIIGNLDKLIAKKKDVFFKNFKQMKVDKNRVLIEPGTVDHAKDSPCVP